MIGRERVYTNMNCAIWGTGNVGKYIYRQLKTNENYSVTYFVDSNPALWGEAIEGIEVISPERLQNIYADQLEFVLLAYVNAISIYENLVDMGIKRFGVVHDRVFDEQLVLQADLYRDGNIFWYDKRADKPLLRTLETNIVDYCNLNCRGCSHFSNLFENGEKIPFDTFCRDLRQIAEHLSVFQFNMLGGEALLDEQITEYIKFARQTLPHSKIQLITNGLLIPKQPEAFFICCRENNIRIIVSEYRPTALLKDKILEILQENQISFFVRRNRDDFGKNIDLTGTADKYEAVTRCRESKCQFFRNGKLYKCPFEALGNQLFEHYHLDIRFHGGIDIYEDHLDWVKLAEMLSDHPVDACRYCGEEEKIRWDVTHAPALEDWVVRME